MEKVKSDSGLGNGWERGLNAAGTAYDFKQIYWMFRL